MCALTGKKKYSIEATTTKKEKQVYDGGEDETGAMNAMDGEKVNCDVLL